RPVDLVDHDARPRPAGQLSHQARKSWAAPLGGRLMFFEPLPDVEAVLTGVPFNRRALLLKGDAEFALAGSRHTDIGTKRFHRMGVVLILSGGIDLSIEIVEVP